MKTTDPARHSRPVRRALSDRALLTVHEVTSILKVPASWVYEHTRPGCRDPLPALKVGKYLRFFADDIFDYLRLKRTKQSRSA